MIRILLLDCSTALADRLKKQGFDVESGTIGFSTGSRWLPSQVYEEDIFVYNPSYLAKLNGKGIEDYSPEYKIEYLEPHIVNGATFLVFVNRVSEDVAGQNAAYNWIPFMPLISYTKDKVIVANSFERYPDHQWRSLAPVVAKHMLDIPVLQRVKPPKPADYPCDVFWLFGNEHGHVLGVLIKRGHGQLIVLPKFNSNEDIVEIFLNRVVPKIYDLTTKIGLVDKYVSPVEQKTQKEIDGLQNLAVQIEHRLEATRAALATARREKNNTINGDPTARQVLSYYDAAVRQDDVALFYLYKVVESIEHKYGGEAVGIRALGFEHEWKLVKKIANASYGDIRHAPKPGDLINKWSDAQIKTCFEATEKVILAYFGTLFASPPPSPIDSTQSKG